MAKKEVTLFNGQLIVVVQDMYDVYEKSLPDGIDSDVNWLGNFGIKEKKSGKKLDGKVPKYQIQVPNIEGKKLYFWANSKKNLVPTQKTVTKKNKKFRQGELDLGDPPVGWEK